MRCFLKYLLALLALMSLMEVIVSLRYRLTFPRPAGPRFDRQVRKDYLNVLVEKRPDIVLLGDSTLIYGLDEESFSLSIGRPAYRLGIQGSASAFWYLVLKNNIVESPYKPPFLVIVFRDTILTAPGFRVEGSYFEPLDEYARINEPLLLQLAFVNEMNPLERWADSHLPVYTARIDIRKEIDHTIRYANLRLMGCDAQCVDASLENLFIGANLDPDAVTSAEGYLYTPDQFDFDHQIGKSFLPEMIRLAKENNVQIVFVRIKTLVRDSLSVDPLVLENYLSSLRSYLERNDIPFLDFGSETRLTDEYFISPTHMSEEGRRIFTQLLADELKPLLKQLDLEHKPAGDRRGDRKGDVVHIFVGQRLDRSRNQCDPCDRQEIGGKWGGEHAH